MSKTHIFKISFGQLDNRFWIRCPIVQNVQLTALLLGLWVELKLGLKLELIITIYCNPLCFIFIK